MKRDPLVSVVMPLYNKRPYVEWSIESIKKQTYTNWELIIVDDGSTDGSADVIPRDDQRIKLFRQPNRGPGAARNRAVRMSSGDYIAFIDGDDCYYPFKLKKEIELLWGKKLGSWMMSAYDYQVDGATKRYYMKYADGSDINDKTIVCDDALKQLTVAGWPSDGLFMKRTLFEQLGGFNEEMRYGEITELILRCVLFEPRIVICHVPLYLHIDVPGSTAKMATFKSEASRHMGKSMHRLSNEYPKYSAYLMQGAGNHLLSYAATLILKGEGGEARRFLSREFPFGHNIKWWKMWIGSWLPEWFLAGLIRTRKG